MKSQSKIKLRVNKAIKENPSIAGEAFFQILNLIISIFAFSFMLAAASAVASPSAAAQTSYACCEKVKDKDLFCQNSLQSNCDTKFAYAPTSCDSTSFCRLGCCYDSKEGTCAENTPRKVCELQNGTFDVNAECNIPQCQMGCCVLGDQASLTTLVRCKKLASFYGLETDYRSGVTSEAECVGIAQAADRGACVIATGVETTCKLTTRADCKSLTHNETAFNKGFLCSAEQLGTPCTRQHHTGCIDGRDEVYWFDSCNNPENIYDANKDRSWNSGKILEKEKSCDPNDNNAKDPNCGNCNYYQGSMCGKQRAGIEPRPASGDYICRDLNCYKTYNGKDYKHGESWCVYDGTVGQGRDLVGSRHWRHLCVMGEEKLEPCDDYRQGICIQGSIDVSTGNQVNSSSTEKFTEANCVPNRWRECIDYNNKPNKESLCKNNNDCYLSTFKDITMCLPSIPPGFNLKAVGEGAVATTVCSLGSSTCVVVYEKTLTKGWVCKQNCECKEQSWVNKANKKCASMGDCGIKYNIAMKYTNDGYVVTNNNNNPSPESSEGSDDSMNSFLTGGITLAGFLLIPKMLAGAGGAATGTAGAGLWAGELGAGGHLASAIPVSQLPAGTYNFWGGHGAGGAMLNLAATAISGYIINKVFGLRGEAATLVMVSGLATTLGVSVAINTIGIGILPFSSSILGAFGMWAASIYGIIVMILVAVVMKMMGIGKTKTEIVTFTCLPWQPPSGGDDCEKCNKPTIGGEMKPCSAYRCNSLGASCSLLNEGTGSEVCTWLNKNDANAPTIKPWQDVLTKDHSYQGVKPCPPGPGCWKIIRDKAIDGCIKAYTPLQFGVETNEPAQCRVDINHTGKFDDMQFFFGDNLYMYNHSMQMSLPAPTHVNAQAESPELKNDGKYTLYIRCRDGNGNWNLGEMAVSFCVEPGPDTTPPMIMRTSVENGAPISFGAGSVPLDLFLNEPSECKWSRTDQAYENMNNTFSCSSNIEQFEGDLTYKCSTSLTKVSDRVTNTFYFRCKDQPWLVGNESERNVNKESYVFKLQGTIPLNITEVGPNGTIKGGAEPIQVTLTVDTMNGYSYGDATCYYGAESYDNTIEFFTTGTNHHEQKLDLWAGDYKLYILCRDLAGNIDKNLTTFKVELDKTAPLIIRAYQDAGMLKIITDEESDCKYGIKDCNFDFTTATDMPFANSTEHTAEWRTDITYYIKCKDQYGNLPLPSACQMQVNAYDVAVSG